MPSFGAQSSSVQSGGLSAGCICACECISFSYSTHVCIDLDKECPLSASQVPLGVSFHHFIHPVIIPTLHTKRGADCPRDTGSGPPGFKPKCPRRRGSGSSHNNTRAHVGLSGLCGSDSQTDGREGSRIILLGEHSIANSFSAKISKMRDQVRGLPMGDSLSVFTRTDWGARGSTACHLCDHCVYRREDSEGTPLLLLFTLKYRLARSRPRDEQRMHIMLGVTVHSSKSK